MKQIFAVCSRCELGAWGILMRGVGITVFMLRKIAIWEVIVNFRRVLSLLLMKLLDGDCFKCIHTFTVSSAVR